MLLTIPKQCQYVLQVFEQAGHSAYLVGGCVRDSILGVVPKDWDICTSALPEDIIDLFAQHKVILTGLQHGTVTILLDKMAIEVTTYRIDGEYLDNRRPKEVFFTDDLQADLSRRDFTINALAYHPDQGIIDYFGGLSDLEQGLIKAVGHASSRFHEDGLRIMRAVRFACVLNFAYDPQTKMAIIQDNYLLKNIACERIQAELNKILLSEHVAKGLEDLYHLGCFGYFMPEICHCYGFEQNNPYHCHDVFGHIIHSVAAVEPDLTLRLTMLLHDIGKPFVWCTCFESSDCFPLHDHYSSELADRILDRLRYDRQTQREVVKLVKYHTYQLEDNGLNIRQALSLLGEASIHRLIRVKIADMVAQKQQYHADLIEHFARIEQRVCTIIEQGQCYSLKQLALNGNDLKALGYQGSAIGETLQKLLALVIEHPKYNQRQILLDQLQK